jgi:hypothetical protein
MDATGAERHADPGTRHRIATRAVEVDKVRMTIRAVAGFRLGVATGMRRVDHCTE